MMAANRFLVAATLLATVLLSRAGTRKCLGPLLEDEQPCEKDKQCCSGCCAKEVCVAPESDTCLEHLCSEVKLPLAAKLCDMSNQLRKVLDKAPEGMEDVKVLLGTGDGFLDSMGAALEHLKDTDHATVEIVDVLEQMMLQMHNVLADIPRVMAGRSSITSISDDAKMIITRFESMSGQVHNFLNTLTVEGEDLKGIVRNVSDIVSQIRSNTYFNHTGRG